MKSFRLSITRDGKLSIVYPECGSTKVEVTNCPVNEVDKIKCRHCGHTLYRPFPQPKGYHQVTIDELDKKDDEEPNEIREHASI